MLHAKILVIDDFITVGSSNLDHLSFFQNHEADVMLGRPENRAIIFEQFKLDLAHSEKINLSNWQQRPLTNKLLEKFFYMLRIFL